MTEKRWKIHEIKDRGWGLYDLIDTEKNRKYQFDVTDRGVRELVVTLLNELSEENEQCKMMIATLLEENQSIKKHIGELYKYVKIDVDNEIEVYPKALLEGIVDILKIIGDVE